MEEIKIRLIKESELGEIADLVNQSYLVPYKISGMVTRANDTPEKISLKLENGSKVFVAMVGNKIVGSARCKLFDGHGIMSKLAVDNKYRCHGIGKKLIDNVLQHAKSNGANDITIEVAEDKGLIPYYESFGFTVAKRYLHKNHHEVLMVKNLTS